MVVFEYVMASIHCDVNALFSESFLQALSRSLASEGKLRCGWVVEQVNDQRYELSLVSAEAPSWKRDSSHHRPRGRQRSVCSRREFREL